MDNTVSSMNALHKQPAPNVVLYPASWVDRFTTWVERLPIPWLAFYVALWVGMAAFALLVTWREGVLPSGTMDSRIVLMAVWAPYCLAAAGYLSHSGGQALDAFRPALDVDAAEFGRLRYEFTVLPFWPVIWANIFGALVAVSNAFLQTNTLDLLSTPLSAAVNLGIAAIGIALSFSLIYFTFRQLRLIRHTYRHATRLNLFQSGQLYAFSALMLRTGIIWLVVIYSGVIAFPDLLKDVVWASISTLMMLAIGVAFVSTLMEIQQRIRGEKLRHLDEIDRHLQSAFADLHSRISTAETADLANLHQVMESLVLERGVVAKIPTWPWQPGTAASFLTAVSLPLIIWAIQALLQRLTGL